MSQADLLKWATECLIAKGHALNHPPELLLETPWSKVIRFSTTKGDIYLKQTPPTIAAEPKIIHILADQLQAHVPFVIASNDDLHCFLMKDAGQTLREYLKKDFQPDLLCQAVKGYAAIQRATENNIEDFLALGAPDWRVEKLPALYEYMISQEALLLGDGLTHKELQQLSDLGPQFLAQCEMLAQCHIPPTIAIYDINTNNVLIDPNTKKMTYIDWGEAVITHPFFSLHTYLYQATIHHSVKEYDSVYCQLQEAAKENWLDVGEGKQISEAFNLAKKFWPIYSVLSCYRLIDIIGLPAYNSFYANRPHRITTFLKEYILKKDNLSPD